MDDVTAAAAETEDFDTVMELIGDEERMATTTDQAVLDAALVSSAAGDRRVSSRHPRQT